MANYDDCGAACKLPDGIMYSLLGDVVNGVGGLVQNQDIGPTNQRPRKRDSLALTTGKAKTTRPDLGV